MQTFFRTASIVTGKTNELGTETVIHYVAAHNNGKTTLDTDIKLNIPEGMAMPRITYSLEFGKLNVRNEEEALDKLADWMARTAEAIKARKAPERQIIVY